MEKQKNSRCPFCICRSWENGKDPGNAYGVADGEVILNGGNIFAGHTVKYDDDREPYGRVVDGADLSCPWLYPLIVYCPLEICSGQWFTHSHCVRD